MSRAKPIYVEIVIRTEMDRLWQCTQDPQLHEQWDLRFTSIEYLPKSRPEEPQQFLYATRIGFGWRIEGQGESVGENDGAAGRVSALKFWSDDPKSLIKEGSGYWKYVPVKGGVRFFTRYDYRTRFGWIGSLFDLAIFRPLLGWATAWSFDRLRLWIEDGVSPAVSMQRSAVYAVARITLAFIWIYQGLVPKLLAREVSGELETVCGSGLFQGHEHAVLTAAAIVEIGFGVLLLALWRARWLFTLNIIAMIGLAFAALVSDRLLFVQQFNPATLNAAMIGLALVGLIAARNLPTAQNCLRRESPTPST